MTRLLPRCCWTPCRSVISSSSYAVVCFVLRCMLKLTLIYADSQIFCTTSLMYLGRERTSGHSTPSDTITANPPPIRPANTQICPAVFITAEHKHSFSSQKCSHTLFTEAYQRLIIDFHGSAACRPSWRCFEPHATKTERRVMQKEALESPALHLIDLLLFHQQRWELLLSYD